MDIVYQTYVHGLATYLMKKEREDWLSTPIKVRSYNFTSSKHVVVEFKALQAFHFGVMGYQKTDPEWIFSKQVPKLGLLYPYAYFINEDGEVFQGVTSFEEIQSKMENKKNITLKVKRNEAPLAKKDTTSNNPTRIQIQV